MQSYISAIPASPRFFQGLAGSLKTPDTTHSKNENESSNECIDQGVTNLVTYRQTQRQKRSNRRTSDTACKSTTPRPALPTLTCFIAYYEKMTNIGKESNIYLFIYFNADILE